MRAPETAPPKPVVFEVIALIGRWVTATLSKGKDRPCKQPFSDEIGAKIGFFGSIRKNPSPRYESHEATASPPAGRLANRVERRRAAGDFRQRCGKTPSQSSELSEIGGRTKLNCTLKTGAMCKRVQFGGPPFDIDGPEYRPAGKHGRLEAGFFNQPIVLSTEHFRN